MNIPKWILYPLWLLVGEVYPIWLFSHNPTEATVLLFCGSLGIALGFALVAELGKLVDMTPWKVVVCYSISLFSTGSWYIIWFWGLIIANIWPLAVIAFGIVLIAHSRTRSEGAYIEEGWAGFMTVSGGIILLLAPYLK